VGMGCESCHQAASADNKTTLRLRAAGGDLCAKCHEIRKNAVLHGPYQAGQCLICHNPHGGAYEAQTRADVNTLCLSCHMLNQPDARVNVPAKMVSLLDGRVYDLASWQNAPKIGGGHAESHLPRKTSAPVTAKDPGKPGAEPTCLTCHDPHSSQVQHLLRAAGPQKEVKSQRSKVKRPSQVCHVGQSQLEVTGWPCPATAARGAVENLTLGYRRAGGTHLNGEANHVSVLDTPNLGGQL
jgi:predicted CXXCH cytochrome family protein